MPRLFGTDGIRGVVGENLDAALAYKVGRAAAEVVAAERGRKPRFMIGKDTRISGDMLEAALTAGLCAAGADVLPIGVLPTPAVAYLTVREGCDAGVVISASHNPFEHNGIKIFNAEGYKLSDAAEDKIGDLVLSENFGVYKTGGEVGRVIITQDMAEIYADFVAASAGADLSGLRVVVDCANGASSVTARMLFDKLGMKAKIIEDSPNGININDNCGSTHMDRLKKEVMAGGYDAGIAFDGDADRCLALDETGGFIDGDAIMGIVGLDMKNRGKLAGNTLVATVMSNLGFHVFAGEQGIKLITAAVGDRYVLEEMLKNDYNLGGEQSGHLIFKDIATTGDGQLTAVQFLSVLKTSGKKASELAGMIPKYPQVLLNITVKPEEKDALSDRAEVRKAIAKAEELMNGEGRILVRPSGTEPLVRVMVEGREKALVDRAAGDIAAVIEKIAT